MPSPTNVALMKLRRRAEAGGDDVLLVQTFVDVGQLLTLLTSDDHQILYGRRGTGKTHAFTYLRARAEDHGDVAAFVDLRTIGSSGGIYSDPGIPIGERGTRLLMDVLGQVHDNLVDFSLARAENEDMTASLSLLDRLAEAITQVRVVGEHEVAESNAREEGSVAEAGLSADVGLSGPRGGATMRAERTDRSSTTRTSAVKGELRHRVHFGEVSQVLQRLVDALPVKRIWILLDEWAAVPMDLQPYLADLLRRAIFPVRGVVVKIAAIEQRSRFQIDVGEGDYLGIEVGADAAADLDLDDYMVFGNDPDTAKLFFGELLFRHVRVQMEEDDLDPPADARHFQREGFTQRNAFDELEA